MRIVNLRTVVALVLLASSCGASTNAELAPAVQNDDLATDPSSIEVGQSATIQGVWVRCGPSSLAKWLAKTSGGRGY